MIGEDEYLERIVAGIHAVTSSDADVSWNEVINGRQFDVVVRFALGTLRYLVLIEVKNKTRRASAQDLDAFVTKARDQNSNKAVFVSAAGFQAGAIEVGKRHGVDLFQVSFDEEQLELSTTSGYIAIRCAAIPIPPGTVPTLSIGDQEPVLSIDSVTLLFTGARRYALPDEQSQLTYYVGKTRFDDGRVLRDAMDHHPFGPVELNKTRKEVIKLRPPRTVTPPDTYYFPAGKLQAIECVIALRQARHISGNVRIDPGAFRPPVIYTNVVTGTVDRFALDQLPLGTGPVNPGNFYFLLHPLRYYHCADVHDGLVTWELVESFQSGEKMSGAYTQSTDYAPHYIPVTNKAIVKRLEWRLADFQALRSGGVRPVAEPPRLGRRPWQLPWRRSDPRS